MGKELGLYALIQNLEIQLPKDRYNIGLQSAFYFEVLD
jgi:hypothetical protein